MKNRLRKMLSLVLAVVIAMSAISLNTFAATILDIKDGSTNKLYVDWYSYSYNFNGRLNTSTYGQIIKLNVGSPTGQVAYSVLKGCLDKRLYGTKDLQFVVVNATAEFKTRSDLWLSGYNKIWLQR